VREEEGVGNDQVHEEHIEEVEERLNKTELLDEDEEDAWEIEEDVHLDGEGKATENMVRRTGNQKSRRDDGPVQNGTCDFIADGVGVYCG